jgi:hypothetical protein
MGRGGIMLKSISNLKIERWDVSEAGVCWKDGNWCSVDFRFCNNRWHLMIMISKGLAFYLGNNDRTDYF